MSTLNLTGNLGADANLKYTPTGAPVLELRIGHTPRRQTGDHWEDAGPTSWYRGSLWGPLAEAIAESGIATKGARVNVTGTLAPRAYESASGGGISLDVRIDSIGFPQARGGQQRPAAGQQDDPWATTAAGGQEPGW